MLGMSTNCSGIYAAKSLIRKAVFYMGDVDKDCSHNDIVSFVKGLNVNVFSCFEVNFVVVMLIIQPAEYSPAIEIVTWLFLCHAYLVHSRRSFIFICCRAHRTHDVLLLGVHGCDVCDDRKAFRLCISDNITERVIDASLWPDSVTVSKCYFKQPATEDDVGDERRCVGDLSAAEHPGGYVTVADRDSGSAQNDTLSDDTSLAVNDYATAVNMDVETPAACNDGQQQNVDHGC